MSKIETYTVVEASKFEGAIGQECMSIDMGPQKPIKELDKRFIKGYLTDSEVLTKCIEIAHKGGYTKAERLHVDETGSLFTFMKDSSIRMYGTETSLANILFDHSFCKALFGTKPTTHAFVIDAQNDGGECMHPTYKTLPEWQYHVQELALRPSFTDRIQYLREWLEGQDD